MPLITILCIYVHSNSITGNGKKKKKNRGAPRKRKSTKQSCRLNHTSSERREYRSSKLQRIEKTAKKSRVLDKLERLDKKINNINKTIEVVCGGKSPQSLGIVKQLHLADLNLVLDQLVFERFYNEQFIKNET